MLGTVQWVGKGQRVSWAHEVKRFLKQMSDPISQGSIGTPREGSGVLLEIMDREVKRLKRSRIPLVNVRWNSKRGPEFTWEREDQFKKKYPHLFTKTAPSSSAAS
ncbi:hypothetical protein Tco_0649606 [Tanacetum coccineum]